MKNLDLLLDKRELQTVICIKDNKHYVYKKSENPYFQTNDYKVIFCYLLKKSGTPDFSKTIEIYGKDLVSAD